MEVKIGRFRKDVWAISPLKNKPHPSNSEGKRSRHMDFGRKVGLSFDKGSTVLWGGKPWRIHVGQQELTLVSAGNDPFPLSLSAFEALVKQGKIVGVQTETRVSITQEGQKILEGARDVDMARAIFRNRIINPDQYDDEEQEQTAKARADVAEKTKRTWRRRYREAELRYGSGFHWPLASLSQLQGFETGS